MNRQAKALAKRKERQEKARQVRASTPAKPPPRCAICTVSAGWRSNTPELISLMVAITSENSRPTERAVS